MKILFILPRPMVGGTSTVLSAVVRLLSIHKYDVRVFYIFPKKNSNKDMNIYRTLPSIRSIVLACSYKISFEEFGFFYGIVSLSFFIFRKILHIDYREKEIEKAAKKIGKENFDIVVGMEEGVATLLASKVPSKKRIAWIHSDYSRYMTLTGSHDENKTYELFQNIVCVSKYTAKVFSDYYPNLALKTIHINNLIDFDGIINKSLVSDDFIDKNNTMFTSSPIIVSIGRLNQVKRFHLIPKCASYLKQRDQDFVWLIVGDGQEKSKIQEEIVLQHVENEVILTGEMANPYPLLSRATILIILSESEACPSVLLEAMTLKVPVISTDFPTASEFIVNGWNGLITSIEKLPQTIFDTLQNIELLSKLTSNRIAYLHYNEDIEEKILELFDNGQI